MIAIRSCRDMHLADLHELMCAAFADYVEGVTVGPTTGGSERRSLAVAQAGLESVKSGRPVNLHQRFGDL